MADTPQAAEPTTPSPSVGAIGAEDLPPLPDSAYPHSWGRDAVIVLLMRAGAGYDEALEIVAQAAGEAQARISETSVDVGPHRHRYVRRGQYYDRSLPYSSPTCLVCGRWDPQVPGEMAASKAEPETSVDVEALRDGIFDALGSVTRSQMEAKLRSLLASNPSGEAPSAKPSANESKISRNDSPSPSAVEPTIVAYIRRRVAEYPTLAWPGEIDDILDDATRLSNDNEAEAWRDAFLDAYAMLPSDRANLVTAATAELLDGLSARAIASVIKEGSEAET